MNNFICRVILLFTFLLSLPVYAVSESEIENIVRKGLENCYQFRWKNAEKDFENIIRNYPGDPRGYHYKSGIYLWYYLSSGNKYDLDTFIKYSDIALDKAEAILDKEPGNEIINYTLGNAYSYRTLGYAKSESYVNAIWSSKKSEKFLKKVVELNPSGYDAYLGLGLYNFAAAQIPSAFKWALDLAGISGDEETGIKYIKMSASKGSLSKVEAEYYLSQLLFGVTLEYDEAEEILNSLHRKYPANILFSYSLAVTYLKQKNPSSAERLLKNIVKQNHPKFRQVISFSNFLLGDVWFRLNNPGTAIGYYKKFLETTGENGYTGIASLRLGICYEMNGDRSAAVEYYKKSSSGNTDIEDDIFASRKGEVFSRRGLNKFDQLIINSSNNIEAGKFLEAYEELVENKDNIKDQQILAGIYYYLSEAAFGLGKNEESLHYALKGSTLKAGEEGWINAFCYYNAARASKFLGKQKEMLFYLEKADDENDWDYRNQLENMLKALRRK